MIGSDFHFEGRVSASLDENLAQIREICGDSPDLVIRPIAMPNGQRAAVFMVDGLTDSDRLGRDLFAPLNKISEQERYTVRRIAESVLSLAEISYETQLQPLIEAVLQGLTALLLDGDSEALTIQAIGWAQRSVEEPGTDVVIRGPREGFIEAMRVNLSLLRRKLHHPDFRSEVLRLGRYSRTDAALVYIDSIVDREVLAEVKRRLQEIDIDALLDSGSVEQLIRDYPHSLFPTIGIAEKPDIAAARILEGRVCLLLDGSPMALTMPMLFIEGLHSPEDHYTQFMYASWIRLIRGLAFVISLALPGFFVAAVSFHPEIIPVKLLLSMSAAELDTPFSVGLSLLLMSLIFEILREAGVRLPKPTGQAVSIVGAIIMGDAAVSANLISTPVLIVLAFTVVASFVSSVYVDASTLMRTLFLLLGWSLGLFGILLGALLLLLHLCALESFGAPFFAPFAPLDRSGLKDSLIRFPLRRLWLRPRVLSANRRRQAERR